VQTAVHLVDENERQTFHFKMTQLQQRKVQEVGALRYSRVKVNPLKQL